MARGLRFLVAAAALAYAFWDFDLDAFTGAVSGYAPVKILTVLLISLGAYLLLGFRLNRIIPESPGLLPCAVASVFGLGINNLLPARVGELAKVLYLKQRCGLSAARLLGVVFWERFADVHALLVLSVALFLLVDLSRALPPLLGLVVALWGFVVYLRRWPIPARKLLALVPHAGLRHLLFDVHDYLRADLPRDMVIYLAGATLLLWSAYALQIVFMLVEVAGLGLSVPQTLVVFLASALSMAVPVAPGGLGIYEAAVVLSLGWYGVPREEALPVAVTMHMLQYVPVTLFGAVVLARTRLSLSPTTDRGPT